MTDRMHTAAAPQLIGDQINLDWMQAWLCLSRLASHALLRATTGALCVTSAEVARSMMAFEAGGQQHCDALSRSEDSTSDSHLDQHAQLPPGAAVKQHTASAESVPPSQPRSGNVGGELAAVLMPAKRRDDPRSQVQSPEEEPTTPPKPDVRPSPVHTNSEDTQPSATPAELDSPLESKSNELSEQSSLSADLPVSTSAPDLAAASASSSTPADDPASPDSEEALPLPPFTLHIDDGAELATVRPRAGSFLLVESMSATEVRAVAADGGL